MNETYAGPVFLKDEEERPKARFESFTGSKTGRFTRAIGKNARGEFAVVEPQRANFTDKDARTEKIRQLKEAGMNGICKFTTHEGNDPRIIYVVTWNEPAPLTVVADSACKSDAVVVQ
jgi:hypothetical protein